MKPRKIQRKNLTALHLQQQCILLDAALIIGSNPWQFIEAQPCQGFFSPHPCHPSQTRDWPLNVSSSIFLPQVATWLITPFSSPQPLSAPIRDIIIIFRTPINLCGPKLIRKVPLKKPTHCALSGPAPKSDPILWGEKKTPAGWEFIQQKKKGSRGTRRVSEGRLDRRFRIFHLDGAAQPPTQHC